MNNRIVLLASGSGSIAQAIIDAVESGALSLTIAGLISDKDSPVLERARQHNIQSLFVPVGIDRSAWNLALFEAVNDLNPDLVVSVGFMRILDARFVHHFKVINTHPALLPLYPGAHAVRDALQNGATITGTTVHWVDAGVDTGEIIAQVQVPILEYDDEDTLHERIKIQERLLIVDTLKQLLPLGEQ